MQHLQIARCKHMKPAGGGFVDGCGWQGRRPQDGKCPECGSDILKIISTADPSRTLAGDEAALAEQAMQLLKWIKRTRFAPADLDGHGITYRVKAVHWEAMDRLLSEYEKRDRIADPPALTMPGARAPIDLDGIIDHDGRVTYTLARMVR
jgi:hypothetical protein